MHLGPDITVDMEEVRGYVPEGFYGDPRRPRLDIQGIMTEAQLKDMGDEAQKAGQKQKELADRSMNLLDTFDQMVGSALAGASSMDEFTDSLIRAGGQWLASTVKGMFDGFPGGILSGAIQFGVNTLLNKEETIPINDGAVDTRIVEVNDNVFDLMAVRDRGQLAMQYQRRMNYEMSLVRGA